MKQLFSLGIAVLASSLVFTNCTKEAQDIKPETAGEFTIVASASTKTTNDGLNTKWATDDGINLFHAEAGTTTYENDNEFSVSAADLTDGKFKGTLAAALESGKSYDWYATYPYSDFIKTPANTSAGYSYIGCRSDNAQNQTGTNNLSHIAGSNYPLYGKATGVSASDVPAINMKPAFSVVEINVKNTTNAQLSVSNIKFTAPESIVGTFYIDFSGDNASFKDFTYVSNTATLNVSEATIPANSSAKFYLAVKPFTATSGSELSIAVNGYSKKLTLSKDASFEEGKIKQVAFDYDKTSTSNSYVLVFNKNAGPAVSAYDQTWEASCNGHNWTITNFNNNRWNNNWTYIKCGSRNSASVASITTKKAFESSIEEVIINFGSVTTDSVNSSKLYIATDAGFSKNLQTVDISLTTGDVKLSVPTPTSNCYYKLEFDCKRSDKNGTITINKITYNEKTEK